MPDDRRAPGADGFESSRPLLDPVFLTSRSETALRSRPECTAASAACASSGGTTSARRVSDSNLERGQSLTMDTSVRFASSAKVYPHQDGTLQSQINHPVAFLHKLPDTCSYEQASLVEPLSVVLNAARRAGIRAGHRVLVLGAGAVGLLACSVASAHGATNLVIVDMYVLRLP